MVFPWASVTALGAGGLADFLGSSSAQREQRRNFDKAMEAYQKALKKGKKLHRKERDTLKAAFALANREFKRPEAALASQGRQLTRDMRRAEERRTGDAKAAALRGGMSPTLLRFLQQQSATDIGRAGRRAFSSLAGQRAGVQSQRAGTKIGLQRELAGSFTRQAAFGLRGAEGLVQNVLGAAQPTSSPVGPMFGQLAAFLNPRGTQPTQITQQSGMTPWQLQQYQRGGQMRFTDRLLRG
jgi:hypothetical protein